MKKSFPIIKNNGLRKQHQFHDGTYRGTKIISCGTFQERTAFQTQQGHVPTPGAVILLELKTGKAYEKNFYKEEEVLEKSE